MIEVADLNSPDETRKFEKGRLELVKIGGSAIGRGRFEPGWRWSTHVKPIAKTESCEAPHFQYHVTGTLHIAMDDGTEKEVGPGGISYLPAGHDAWVVGDEPVVVVDFQGMLDYAKGPTSKKEGAKSGNKKKSSPKGRTKSGRAAGKRRLKQR